jgi:hypothetical protein
MTKEFLNELFEYKDGMLYWKKPGKKRNVGERAGNSKGEKNHREVRVFGFGRHLEHRIIWIMHNGKIPNGFEIDHRDEIKDNNLISNLRLATRSQNKYNTGKQKFNTSGLKGICFHKRAKKWKASISYKTKNIHLGYFNTPEEAHEAYKEAALKFHGEFANFK